MAPANSSDTCWICGSAISCEMCTFDGTGQPVHGPCLNAMLALNGKIKPLIVCKSAFVVPSDGHAHEVLS